MRWKQQSTKMMAWKRPTATGLQFRVDYNAADGPPIVLGPDSVLGSVTWTPISKTSRWFWVPLDEHYFDCTFYGRLYLMSTPYHTCYPIPHIWIVGTGRFTITMMSLFHRHCLRYQWKHVAGSQRLWAHLILMHVEEPYMNSPHDTYYYC